MMKEQTFETIVGLGSLTLSFGIFTLMNYEPFFTGAWLLCGIAFLLLGIWYLLPLPKSYYNLNQFYLQDKSHTNKSVNKPEKSWNAIPSFNLKKTGVLDSTPFPQSEYYFDKKKYIPQVVRELNNRVEERMKRENPYLRMRGGER